MPTILDPHNEQSRQEEKKTTDLRSLSFDYDYPEGLDLRPGYEFHDALVDEILMRARDSSREVSQRYSDWKEVDRNLKAYYYRPKRVTESTQQMSFDERIVMPVSMAILETILTYMTAAFMQNPVFTYEGESPEDILGGMLLTQVVQKHVRRNSVGLNFHTAWRDAFSYGMGVVAPKWKRKYGRKIERAEVGLFDTLMERFFVQGEERRQSEYKILFEGNALDNIDPLMVLPDPTVSGHEPQEGEFFGWFDTMNIMQILREEDGPEPQFFNGRYFLEVSGKSSLMRSNAHRRSEDPTRNWTSTTTPVDLIWMYIDLIPSQWGLGDSDTPEKWTFCLGGDKVLLAAEPVRLAHNEFPVAVAAPGFDGYSMTPTSRLMDVSELQHVVDFLYTSHIANVKRVINDNLVVDPSLINIHDVNDSRPGKIIRLRRRAWGQAGIDAGIKQLQVQDVTQGHVADADYLMNLARQVTGATDNLQGLPSQRTTRISASESRDLRASSLSRMERPARIISMQMMLPIARQFASNTQQFMTEDLFIKTVGDMAEKMAEDFGIDVSAGRHKVTPMDLVVDYDVEPHDGTIPGQENVEAWTDLFQVLVQDEELRQEFDVPKIFKHIARQMGAKNVDQFVERQLPNAPEVMPDEQIQQAVQQGDAIPVDGI